MKNDKPASTAHIRGAAYENKVAEILNVMGYEASVHEASSASDYDLLVNGLPVEVKGAKIHAYNGKGNQGFQFAIKRVTSSNSIDCPIVILYCENPGPTSFFVIPLAELNGAHSITVPNQNPAAYHGKWSKYYNRFDLLDLAILSHGLTPRPGTHTISRDTLDELNAQIKGGK